MWTAPYIRANVLNSLYWLYNTQFSRMLQIGDSLKKNYSEEHWLNDDRNDIIDSCGWPVRYVGCVFPTTKSTLSRDRIRDPGWRAELRRWDWRRDISEEQALRQGGSLLSETGGGGRTQDNNIQGGVQTEEAAEGKGKEGQLQVCCTLQMILDVECADGWIGYLRLDVEIILLI